MRLTKGNLARIALPAGKAERIVFDDDLKGFGLVPSVCIRDSAGLWGEFLIR